MTKDTNRKIRKTEFIYICHSKNGSSSSTVNTGTWNQNSTTVIYEKCCSYLSISIFNYSGRHKRLLSCMKVSLSHFYLRIVIEAAFTGEMTFTTLIIHRSTIHDITQTDTSSLLFILTRHQRFGTQCSPNQSTLKKLQCIQKFMIWTLGFAVNRIHRSVVGSIYARPYLK